MNKEKFNIIATMFKGYTDYGKDENGKSNGGSYTYEITFNRSMEHTGRFRFIEDGLNAGLAKEIEDEEKRQAILDKLTPEERELLTRY